MKSGLMLGVNANTIREENDFYATHPHALEIFLPKLKKDIVLNHKIWECACGNGTLSNVLSNQGYAVLSTDLVDRGFGFSGYDFLKSERIWNGDILTNPPFKFAEKFVEKGMELLDDNNYLILLLKIQFLESKKRKGMFEKFPPKYVYINSERQICARNADFEKYTASTQCYCWYVWEKGYKGETILKWI